MALLGAQARWSRIASKIAATSRDFVERRKSSASATSDRPMTGTSASSGHQQGSREALGVALIVGRATGLARVDGVAVEAQGGDEAPFGVVGLEDLDVRGVVDALGGQGGDPAAVDDGSHRSSLGSHDAHFAPVTNS